MATLRNAGTSRGGARRAARGARRAARGAPRHRGTLDIVAPTGNRPDMRRDRQEAPTAAETEPTIQVGAGASMPLPSSASAEEEERLPPSRASVPAPASGPVSMPLDARYEDLGRIGRGGMGEVRRVRDHALGRVLAMKLLPWDLLEVPQARARFVAEARVTASLEHPGVVPVHDAGELPDGRPWFTMKEVRGVTLREVIEELHLSPAPRAPRAPRSPRWPLRRVLELFSRCCEAVAYAHSRGLVHRDLKPANMMVGEFGEVLVLDWGIAKQVGAPDSAASAKASTAPAPDLSGVSGVSGPGVSGSGVSGKASADLTRPGDIIGTLAYMPPEQARGEQQRIDRRSDVYALGAVLYEILSGQPPYVGAVSAVWKAILGGPPAPVADLVEVPAELAAICTRAMERSPEDRFPDAGALAAEVRNWLDGAHRRERALALVERARAMRPGLEALRARAGALAEEARVALGAVRSFSPVEEKERGWALEDEAARLRREAAVEEVGWLQTLRSALEEVPELPEAHEILADHYHEQVVAAEARRDAGAAAAFEALLRAHDRGRHRAFLSGEGALSLLTEPAGARVQLYRYVERRRALTPELVSDLGATPLEKVRLEQGSYLLRVSAPGHHEMRYPVCIGRGEHWDGVPPGARAPRPVPLLREGELEPDAVYVPAGWFHSGGDEEACESLPMRRVWVEGLVVQRFPVTNAEYLGFLNALLEEGRVEEALEACPRVGLGRSRPGEDALGFAQDAAGRFALSPSVARAEEELRWPVAFVSWHGALGYARWLAARTGKPWRLLNELEWEKAARGVDGRRAPWGDFVDPTFACMLGSHPGVPGRLPVDGYPVDESPYGARGMAGNVRDWCVNVWKPDGPEVRGGVAQVEAAEGGDPALRAARGGSWTTAPNLCRLAGRFAAEPAERFGGLGFRLARPVA